MSLRDIPQSSVECDADVTNLVGHRDNRLRTSENDQEPNHPGITHSILWAMVRAMKEERHRLFRGRLSEDEQSVLIGEGIHVGLAVLGAGDDLIVPVIRNAQNLDLTELTASTRALQKKSPGREHCRVGSGRGDCDSL
jgi:pyruvate/2-oxoglutarate dehydrogenase complex dihydrolipoamide acyltransferase (E2) component